MANFIPRELSFVGRINRKEYLISFIICCFMFAIGERAKAEEDQIIQQVIASFFVYWFFFAQSAKRCHDIGISGWWQLIPLSHLILLFVKSDKGTNKYGKIELKDNKKNYISNHPK